MQTQEKEILLGLLRFRESILDATRARIPIKNESEFHQCSALVKSLREDTIGYLKDNRFPLVDIAKLERIVMTKKCNPYDLSDRTITISERICEIILEIAKNYENATVNPKVKSSDKPKFPTLSELFKSDFPNLLKLDKTSNCIIQDIVTGAEITSSIQCRVYMDFSANSKFIGLYLPHSQESYPIADVFSQICQNFIKDVDAEIKSIAKHPGDSASTDSSSLSFSGRVYIYHDDDFSLQQKAALETLYKNHNLSVIFRGHDYLILNMQKSNNFNTKKYSEVQNSKQRCDGLINFRRDITNNILCCPIIETPEVYDDYFQRFSKLHRSAATYALENDFPDAWKLETLGTFPGRNTGRPFDDKIKSMAAQAIRVIDYILDEDKKSNSRITGQEEQLSNKTFNPIPYIEGSIPRELDVNSVKLHHLIMFSLGYKLENWLLSLNPPTLNTPFNDKLRKTDNDIGYLFYLATDAIFHSKELNFINEGINYTIENIPVAKITKNNWFSWLLSKEELLQKSGITIQSHIKHFITDTIGCNNKMTPKPITGVERAALLTKCKQWLEEVINASNRIQTHNKDKYYEDAKSELKDDALSRRLFDDAWKAKAPENWKKPKLSKDKIKREEEKIPVL